MKFCNNSINTSVSLGYELLEGTDEKSIHIGIFLRFNIIHDT